jgi:hypothetical protein
MGLHWTDLARLETAGGAVWRKHARLVEQAHGAQPGSSAALARLAFEDAWMADTEAVKAECEAEEGLTPRRRRKPKLVEQMTDEELLGTRHDEEPV